MAMSEASSFRCSVSRSAALRMMATRSCQGRFAHSGKAALAAATASRTSSRVACANSPITVPSIGERASLYPLPSRASPFTKNGCFWPSHDLAVWIPWS
jgi:hypothetical protein